MVELQVPTDFSILLEIPPGDGIVPDLGLGWSVALDAIDREALSERQLRSRLNARRQARSGVSSLLPDEAEPYFRAERIAPDPVAELDREGVIPFLWSSRDMDSSCSKLDAGSCAVARRSRSRTRPGRLECRGSLLRSGAGLRIRLVHWRPDGERAAAPRDRRRYQLG